MRKGTTRRVNDDQKLVISDQKSSYDICVKFGSVKVEVPTPKKSKVKRNVKNGQIAMARAMSKIVKPGVKIKAAKGVPLFHTESKHPGEIVRELDGKRTIGRFVNGRFIVSR